MREYRNTDTLVDVVAVVEDDAVNRVRRGRLFPRLISQETASYVPLCIIAKINRLLKYEAPKNGG